MRIWQLFRRNRLENDLDEEIRAHLAMAARDRIDRGEEPEAAEAAARREFGNRTSVKETTRDILGWNTVERVLQDLRYGLRGLHRSPGFTFIAIASLALGIGANTAIFSLMATVMFRLLPVHDPGSLVELLQKYPGEPRGNGAWTWKDYEHFSAYNTVFSDIIGTSFDNSLRLQTQKGVPQHAVGEYVTPNYFSDLGVQPAMGRMIGPEDDPASQDAAVVSWKCWQTVLSSDPHVIGKRIFVQNQPVTIIGVAPPDFVGPRIEAATDVWLPRKRTQGALSLLTRLKPGVTLEQARAEMAVLYRFTIEERAARSGDPLVRKLKVEVGPAGDGLNTVRDRFGKPLLILMAVVALLLLITCVNLASLLLARGAAREREFAVRVGLGASRTRLFGQVLTESLLLSISGALIGIPFAYFGALSLSDMLGTGRMGERVHLRMQPDPHVLLFSATIAIATGLFFGMAPALSAIRTMPVSALRQIGSIGETRSKRFWGKSLVVMQVALSVLLLSTGALFITHLWNLEHIDLGFRRDHVLLTTLDSSNSGYTHARLASGYQEILARLERIPGVRSVALAGPTPLSGAGASGFVDVTGHQESPADRRWIEISYISPNYFHTIGSPILAGRDFNSQDQSRPRVVIINESFARHYFGHANPIGKQITLFHVTLDPLPKTYEVIGVTADAHYGDIREPKRSGVYLPAFHDGVVSGDSFVVRTNIDPEDVTGDVRAALRDVLPNVPVLLITTLNAQIGASIVPERLIAVLSGSFAALGAVLAVIGIYGLLAYAVARRTNEIGIRIALGATTGNVRRMVLRDTLGIVVAGLVLGIPLAILGRFFAAKLARDLAVPTTEPIVLGVLIIVLGALLASYVPARRAAHVDPIQALRHE
jgi:putative ABC transport system permease protein